MASETENVAPPRAGRREWIGLAVIAIACILYGPGRRGRRQGAGRHYRRHMRRNFHG
jgi:hypothetical protein